VIRKFRHAGLRRLFHKADSKKVDPQHVEKIENILAVLNRASQPATWTFRLSSAPSKG